MATDRSPVTNHATAGNARAATHGATSEIALAPVRQRHQLETRQRFPWLDDHRLAVYADAVARFENASRFLDTAGRIVKDKHLNVFPVSDRLDTWGRRIWQMRRELEEEDRARRAADVDGTTVEDELAEARRTREAAEARHNLKDSE